MAVKLVIEPLFEADFVPCSFGFRPEKTPRMALSIIAEKTQAGYSHVVDVDLKSYFDTISHELLLELVGRRVGDVRVMRLIRAWLKAGVMEEGKVTHADRGSPQGGVVSPLLSNIMLHEVDRQWCRGDGTMSHSVVLVRYADDMVLLARTESEAKQAWERLQSQFAALRLVVDQEKSRLTTAEEGFAFLGFEFRKPPRRVLYMWPGKKACQHIRDRVGEGVRSFPSSASIGEVIRKLNPILNGWCTYFRAGNSNRIFHQIDWAVLSELQLWLRRKHQRSWRSARKRWNYQFLYKRCRLYQMVGRVSHLPGLRRTPPEEDGRRAGCGKSARPVVCPAKAGVFSGGQTHRGKSQTPRSLDSREERNRISETYRRHHPWDDGEPSGRNESERIGGLESVSPGAKFATGGRRQHGASQLAEAATHPGGVIAAARWQGCAKQLEKPSSSRREIDGAGKPYNWAPRKSAEDERVSEGLVVAAKRSNVRGAKEPCCL